MPISAATYRPRATAGGWWARGRFLSVRRLSELSVQFCFDVVLRLIPSQCIKMIMHPREADLHGFQPALEPVETQQQDCGQVIKTELGRQREGLPLPICRRHSTKYEQRNGLRSPRVPRKLPTHFLAKLLHVNLPLFAAAFRQHAQRLFRPFIEHASPLPDRQGDAAPASCGAPVRNKMLAKHLIERF